jgi:hypothetical protein
MYRIKGDPALISDTLASNWKPLQLGERVWVVVNLTWGSLSANASVIVQMA